MDNTSRGEILARQALGRNVQEIKDALGQVQVVLGLPDELARTRHGQIGLLAATNILGRLGALAPNLSLDVPSSVAVLPDIPLLAAGEPLGPALLDLARRLVGTAPPGSRRLVDRAKPFDIGLFVGRPTADAKICLTIGADRWLASMRTDGGPEPIDTFDPNPLGVIMAASLGAAEVVKHMWLPVRSSSVAIEPVRGRMTLSAYDLSVNNSKAPNPPMPDQVELGHACVFGLGATGSGCMFVLACLRGLKLSLDMCDFDRIEASNLERLFTSREPQTDVGQFKAAHAKTFFATAAPEISAFPYALRFEQFADLAGARDRLGYVWSCLDSAAARRDLALELPGVVCNAGTDGATWTFSTHEYGRSEHACLRDLYPPPGLHDFNPAKELAERLGLDLPLIERWRQSGQPIDPVQLQAAAAKQADPAKQRMIVAFAGLPFNQAVARICSTMRPHEAAPAATIGFVAIQPSIAMIADLVKRRVYGWKPGPDSPNLFQFDTLRCPDTHRALTIRASTQCLCQTLRYMKAFQTRQEMWQSQIGRTFTTAVPSPQPAVQLMGARRRILMHAPVGRHFLPGGRAPCRPLNPIQAEHEDCHHLPVPEPPVQARPALRGWRGAACRAGAILTGLLAGILHLVAIAALLAALGLFVHWRRAGVIWQPWRVVADAWNSRISLTLFGLHAGLCAGLVAGSILGMGISAAMLRAMMGMIRRVNPALAYNHPRLAARGLEAVFDSTYIPLVWVSVIALWAIIARSAWRGIHELPCCGFILIGFILLFIAMFAASLPTQAIVQVAKRLQKWVLP